MGDPTTDEPKTDRPVVAPVAAKPKPKSKRTPRPVVRPRAKAKRKIPVEIGTRPYAKLYLNGGKRAHSTPLMAARAIHLPVGSHRLRFVDESGKQYRYRINIAKDADKARLVVILGKSVRAKHNLTVKELK